MTSLSFGARAPVVFHFISRPLRVVMIDGVPWFVAADVCAVLDIKNTAHAMTRLDDDERGVVLTDTHGGQQEMTIINESGLYSLILGSRKPEARKFKKWITSEVLPSIRQTGSYHACSPGQSAEPGQETLTAADMSNLARLVGLISSPMECHSTWTQAVWFHLRQATGTAAPHRFQVLHLPNLANEIRGIFAMTQEIKSAMRESERQIIKRVLRGGEPAGELLEQARQRMADAAAVSEADLTKRLEPWLEYEIGALAERRPGRHGEPHEANREAMA